ncbi:carbohydrate ABC transporter permease [Acrocarpospora macrocephala]|uniref:sn-glycerol-3-phosphate transport system permease protein UgpE n=1 Tax=Acrocarpospora macrocephala TaxID=150177 RepID=A0A5M3WLA9_9ACTN|nr:carbohydrate ABC transporter permease [Acrocarpospora macrocephala]GES10045.1 sn-glycerol-3-phosphate transport system permease protein UgpE [Acrocarpospora macrocephala]
MRILSRAAVIVAICGAVAVSLFPFYWMVRTSVAPADETFSQGISWVPTRIDLSGYGRAWTSGELGRAMVVGLVQTLGILALQLVTCVPAAYVLAKVRNRATGVALTMVLVGLLVPSQVTLIPLFVGVNVLGIADSISGLILPFCTSTFGIYLIRQQIMSIPDALLDAARADGLGHVRRLTSVVIPIAAPGIAAFSVFSVFAHWNEYLWPLLAVRSAELRTPPLALAAFQQADVGYDYPALTAGAVIVTAPIVVLFLLAQRQFVHGMSGTEITE